MIIWKISQVDSLSNAIKRANESYQGFSPSEICHGHCYEWAKIVKQFYPSVVIKDVDLWKYRGQADLPYHVWVEYGGKAYDAEVPEGVDSFLELPYFKSHANVKVMQ